MVWASLSPFHSDLCFSCFQSVCPLKPNSFHIPEFKILPLTFRDFWAYVPAIYTMVLFFQLSAFNISPDSATFRSQERYFVITLQIWIRHPFSVSSQYVVIPFHLNIHQIPLSLLWLLNIMYMCSTVRDPIFINFWQNLEQYMIASLN